MQEPGSCRRAEQNSQRAARAGRDEQPARHSRGIPEGPVGSSGLGASQKADMACHQESSPHPPTEHTVLPVDLHPCLPTPEGTPNFLYTPCPAPLPPALPHIERDGHHSVEDDDVGPEGEEAREEGTVHPLVPGQVDLEADAHLVLPDGIANGQDHSHAHQEPKDLETGQYIRAPAGSEPGLPGSSFCLPRAPACSSAGRCLSA